MTTRHVYKQKSVVVYFELFLILISATFRGTENDFQRRNKAVWRILLFLIVVPLQGGSSSQGRPCYLKYTLSTGNRGRSFLRKILDPKKYLDKQPVFCLQSNQEKVDKITTAVKKDHHFMNMTGGWIRRDWTNRPSRKIDNQPMYVASRDTQIFKRKCVSKSKRYRKYRFLERKFLKCTGVTYTHGEGPERLEGHPVVSGGPGSAFSYWIGASVIR